MKKKVLFLIWAAALMPFSACFIGKTAEAVDVTAAATASFSGYYKILASHSGKSLCVESASTGNGANIHQWEYYDDSYYDQQWTLNDLGNGYFSIVNRNSGLGLDVYDFSTSNGGNIAQWTYWGGDNQQWAITDLGDGTYSIISKLSGLSLDVEGKSTSNGANILQWTYKGSTNQKWEIVAIGDNDDDDTDDGGAIEILSDHGFEYARIRLLVEPGETYGLHQDLDYVIETATRAKAAGMNILLDIFYSHWWCDPSQNWKPESWSSTFSTLSSKVYSYTVEVLEAMDDAGVLPDMVQVGNEVNDGMMWTPGQISVNGWSNYITLSNQGYYGVKSVSSDIPVIIHYAGIGDDAVSWYNSFVSNGGLLDAAGISFYEMWHGTISECVSTVDQLSSNLGTDVYVVETAAYWKTSEGGNSTSYAHTEQGQYNYLYDLTQALQDSTADGLFYWGAAWTQADSWLYAPAWGDDDAGCRGLFDDDAQATIGVDAIFDAGGLGIVGVDVSEAVYCESMGVEYSDF